MLIVRRIVFGFLWFIVFYFAACMLIGAVAGGFAGAKDPDNAREAGRIAGAEAVGRVLPLIVIGSLLGAAVGSATGFLPGTRGKKEDEAVDEPKRP